ncbi:hypothetical protein [Streptomyces cirratus]|uniref:hypothetical protein n=1 Tax=Streptomyces cirratus TaxID=68187 RepID=UPI0036072944
MTAAVPAAPADTSGVLLGLAVLLAVAYVFGRLAQRSHQPVVIGEIVAGIALGPSLLGLLPGDLSQLFFPPPSGRSCRSSPNSGWCSSCSEWVTGSRPRTCGVPAVRSRPFP